MERNRFRWEVRPSAIPENVVQGKTFRFTVLTPSLIRMEYSPGGLFEDRATQTVFFRDFPKCDYSCRQEDEMLVLETEALILRYAVNKPFDRESLSIKLKIEPASTWRFGEDFEDMGGTTQTLDLTDGPWRRMAGSVCAIPMPQTAISLVTDLTIWAQCGIFTN